MARNRLFIPGLASGGLTYIGGNSPLGNGQGYTGNNPTILLSTTSLVSAYGVLPLSGYSGPVAQATKVADSSTLDVTRTTAVAGDGTYRFSKFYNQVQAGNDLVNATLATMPRASSASGTYRGLVFDGNQLDGPRFLRSTGTMPTLDRTVMTVYAVVNPRKTWEVGSFFEYADAGYTTNYGHLLTNTSPISYDTGSGIRAAKFARLGPQIISVSTTTTGFIVRVGGRETVITLASTSQAVAALQIGQIIFSAAYAGEFDLFGLYTYAASHSSATMQGIEATLASAYGLQDVSSFTRTLVYGQSSLISAYRLTNNNIPPWVEGFGKNTGTFSDVECFNTSAGGQSVATAYGARASTFGALYAAPYNTGKTKFVAFPDGPSNDIANTTFTSLANAQAWATDFIGTTNTGAATNTIIPFITYLKGLGADVRVIFPTIIARGGFDTTTNWRETARTTYNSTLLSIAAAQGIQVSNRAAISQLSNAADTTYYNGDQIHLNDTGSQNYLAPCDLAAITAAFAS